MKKLLFIAVLLASPISARILDRLAITIGYQAITELDIDEELRVTALLNHQPIGRDLESRRAAADRLVQQFLIKREMEISHYPAPEAAEIDAYADEVQKELGGPASLSGALRKYDLDTPTLKKHLLLQLTIMRFVDFRFKPVKSVGDAQSSQRTDEALSAWLESARKRLNIVYVDKEFQ